MSNSPLDALRQALFNRKSRKSKPARRRHSRQSTHSRALTYETLESRELLAVVALGNMSVSEDTGEKPESKLWEYAGQWWSVMPKSDGTWVWRLDGTSWTPTFRLTSENSFHADVKSVGGVTHALLFDGGGSQLASLEYVGGSTGYQFWSQRPTLVGISLSSSAEAATIDIDSFGRMWLANDVSSTVEVRYSDGDYSTWSAPITIASGINSDDISAIIAMPNNTIGVLWSNQSSDRFGFRMHVDGTPADQWTNNEIPASQSALNVGGGMADDHMNVKVTSDGTLYAAVKTSYDTSSRPKIALLVRRPNGVWDNLYQVDTSGTRPIVLVNEAAGRLIVAYTTSESGGNIVFKESPLGNIAFGGRQTLIAGTVNNVTSTKQNFTGQVAAIAAGGSSVKGGLFSFNTVSVNQPPNVNAGPDRTITLGNQASLDGTVTDDGLPAPPALATTWSKISGPGGSETVVFANGSAIDTTATFTTVGTYVLRLTANDGSLSRFDEMTVIVNAADPVGGGGGGGGTTPTQIAFQDGLFPSVTYAGTRDTYLNSGSSNTNYGTANTLQIDGSPDLATLIKWDVSAIPTGSIVTSAAIELNVTNTSSGAYELYALQRAWDEISATWQRYAAGLNWGTAGASNASDRSSAVLGSVTPSNTGIVRIVLNAAGIAAVQSWVNNPALNFGALIQDYTVSSGGNFSSSEAAVASQRPKLLVGYEAATTSPPVNQQPNVDAGPNRSITLSQSAALDGTVTDDGLPMPASLQYTWSQSSGPGTVTFGNSASVDTAASFSQTGTYVLRLTVSDGSLSSFDDMTVVVSANSPTNTAPIASAGPNRTITLGQNASLDGTVTDDNLPTPANLTTTWSKLSGPGSANSVTFANAAAVDTTASFAQPGTYVLRLTANDGALSSFSDMTVIVNDVPPPSDQPVDIAFQDGLFPSLTYAGTRDTYLDSGSVQTNRGSANVLFIDGSPDYSSLLKWDVSAIPAGSIINSVSIELNVTNTSSGAYELYALQRNWDELSATWQQYAIGQNWGTAGANNTTDRNSTVLGSATPTSMGTHRITLNAAGVAAVQAWVNNPSANFGVILQDYAVSSGADFVSREASNAAQRPKLNINYTPPAAALAFAAFGATNAAPIVDAGQNISIILGAALNLRGIVSDDGPLSSITTTWSKSVGPGNVTFASATNLETTAQFAAAGTYTLRLTAFDGLASAFDELIVTVLPALI